jgi:hypothetical protein
MKDEGIGLGVTIHVPLSGVGKSDLSFFGIAHIIGRPFTIRGGNTSGAWQIVARLEGAIDLQHTIDSLFGSTNELLRLPRGFPALTLSELAFTFDAETGDYDAHGRTAATNFSIAGNNIENVSLALGIGSKNGSTRVNLESDVVIDGTQTRLLVQMENGSSAIGLTAGQYEVFVARSKANQSSNVLALIRPGSNAFVSDVELSWAKYAWSSVPFRTSATYPAGAAVSGRLQVADTTFGRLLQIDEPIRLTIDTRELAVEIGNERGKKQITIPLSAATSTLSDTADASSSITNFAAESGKSDDNDENLDEATNAQLTIAGPLSLAPIIKKFAPAADGTNTSGTWRDYVGKCLQLENVGLSLITSPKIGASVVFDASFQVGSWLGVAVRKASFRLIPDKLPFTDIDVDASLQSAAIVLNLPPVVKASAAMRYDRNDAANTEAITGSGQLQLFDKLSIGLLAKLDWQRRQFQGAFGFVFAKGFAVGPPAFQLTGIGGGFGYNRTLVLPKAAEAVATNAIISLLKTDPDGDAFADASRMLDNLHTFMQSLQEQQNAWCIAFGITFRIVEWIDCVALLLVEKRTAGFDVALLGMADFPIGVSSYKLGHVQLGLLTRFNSDDQSLRILGTLTNKSWLLHPNCKLRGGFAVCLWFGGAYAGDFVVSLGGYSPLVPAKRHYPALDRLGFSWKVTNRLNLFGEVYFALDRYGIQFGGRAGLKYTSRILDVDAHFSFDVLSTWRPFFFQTKVRVSLQLELRVITTMRLGFVVDANVYGPPFGAEFLIEIDIKVWRHTFTIRAGSSLEAAKNSAKPNPRDILALAKGGKTNATQIQATGRPLGDNRDAAGSEPVSFAQEVAEPVQRFRADELVLTLTTTIPIKTVYRQRNSTETRHPYQGDCLDIRALGWQDVVSDLIWDIRGPTETAEWVCIPNMSKPLEALWYLPTNDTATWKDSGRKAITSLRLEAPTGRRGDVGLGALPTERLEEADAEMVHTVQSMPGQTRAPVEATSTADTNAESVLKRNSLLEALRIVGFDLDGCATSSPFRPLEAIPLRCNRGAVP